MIAPASPSPLPNDGAPSTPAAAVERMQAAPWEFDFFQALRLIECSRRDLPRLGDGLHPRDEAVRLGQDPDLSFAPAALSHWEQGPQDPAPRLSVRFLGMFGPHGPLPLHLTEYARDRARNSHDVTLSRFLDLFHHRTLTLFYKAWAQGQPVVSFDRPETDRFGDYIGSLFGQGLDESKHRDALSDLTKRRFAGRFSSGTKNAEGLEAILADSLDAPIEVAPFAGHWLKLPVGCQTKLEFGRNTGELGQSATLGERVWDCQSKFRIRVGPVGWERFQEFLPDGPALPVLAAAVRNYIGDELAWDAQIALRREQVPAVRLGEHGRLGHSSWLKADSHSADRADVVFDDQHAARETDRRSVAGGEAAAPNERTVSPDISPQTFRPPSGR